MQFIGFVNTVSLPDSVLPYGLYVREIDLTPVNKYGVDMRVRKLIRYCPNLVSITLGQATSVKADTLQLMGRYCQNVHTLEMGGMISFPFMFDCDFSGMIGLRRLSLLTTPVQSTSLNTIPSSIRHLQIAQLDALQHGEFVTFLKQHPRLISLSVKRCRHINSDFAALILQLPKLSILELIGPEVNDESLKGFFDIPTQLHTLILRQTQITDATLRMFADGCLVVQNLDITNNAHVSQRGIDALLRKKKFEKISSNL
ncbi:hypothetical protein BDF20DRAFT_911864 [Mycotypha africana]|uniref:uncharacterized protein n=1 Tax=Mycotypha africana TaxID=64632 RepID=UPI002300A8CB|nr:uncharacterized protein BDF20DRAFT_911864 [Mycotypha africana]KAI8981589.1 hypothetical protein BDF20DRAFT_911864 [Mycotypha africana]